MTGPGKKVLLVRDDLSECRLIVELIDDPDLDHSLENDPNKKEDEDECDGP